MSSDIMRSVPDLKSH